MRKYVIVFIFIVFSLFIGRYLCSQAVCSDMSTTYQLNESWKTYKMYFIQDDGRVIDYYAQHITTSEGQSYALLRAVWHGDKQTFDKVLAWTNNNLKTRGDNLFAWKWGKNDKGEWTVIDRSSATDAEQDIALALILATERWKDSAYTDEAKAILADMWSKEVINIKGINYLTSGDWAVNEANVKLNPSYLAPYAYRVFAKVDPSHDWNSLVDSSYLVLEKATSFSSVHLPPDWAYINQESGEITVNTDINNKEGDYSYDAIRTHWRIMLDYVAFNEPRALAYIKKSTDFLVKYWQINKSLPSSVTAYGIIRIPEQSFAVYGATLPAIQMLSPESANQIYQSKLSYDYMKGFWANPKDYYAQNLIWFGVSLWHNIKTNNTNLSKKGLLYLLDDN